jgi:hypothetical protein
MTGFVIVDTDVFSYLWQKKNKYQQYAPYLEGSVPVLAFTSIAEAYYGARRSQWGPSRMQNLDEAIRRYVVAP